MPQKQPPARTARSVFSVISVLLVRSTGFYLGSTAAGFNASSVRRDLGQAWIKAQSAFNPFGDAEHKEVLPVAADDLQAERKTASAESGRDRHGWDAEQGPRRAILGVAGIVQT